MNVPSPSRWRNGSAMLIDSGFMNKGGGAAMATKFDIPWWIRLVWALGELGSADQVTDIAFPCPFRQWAIGEFPNAMIYMQKRVLSAGGQARRRVSASSRRRSAPTISARRWTPRSITG
jgi:hypothetical protein